MNTIALDFETFYSQDFSLSNMTTREYIMHPLFEVIGVSVKVNQEPAKWFSGSKKDTKAWLEQFDWENSMAIAHNNIFDGAILAFTFGIFPKMYFCTMMAARPIDVPYTDRMSLKFLSEHNAIGVKGTEVVNAKGLRRTDFPPQHLKDYSKYCIQDTELCYKLFRIYASQLPIDEIKNIHLTIRKFTRPQLVLDANSIHDRLIKHRFEKKALLGECGLESPEVLMSNDKFADALQIFGVSPPRKISERTGKENWAFAKTDRDFLALLDHPNSKVVLLAEARMGHKSTIEESRLTKFLKLAEIAGSWLSVPLLYWGAGTGRFSGLDGLNLQNLPSRGEVGPALRKSIRAPKGRKVLACDFNAIELRMVAAFCNQANLLKQIRDYDTGAYEFDSYQIFVSDLYKIENSAVTKDQRFVGKLCLLSLQYGSGPDKFLDTMLNEGMDIDWDEANRIVQFYRRTMSSIVRMWKRLDGCIAAMAQEDCNLQLGPIVFKYRSIELPNNTKLIYHRLARDDEGWHYYKGNKKIKLYGAMLLENISQALSRIVMTDAELKLADKKLFAAMTVHDELVYVPKTEHVDIYQRAITYVMSQSPPWMPNLPIACEAKYGDTYYDTK